MPPNFKPGVEGRQLGITTDNFFQVQTPEYSRTNPARSPLGDLGAALGLMGKAAAARQPHIDAEEKKEAIEKARADVARMGGEFAKRVSSGDIPENAHPEYLKTGMAMAGAATRGEYQGFVEQTMLEEGFNSKEFPNELGAAQALEDRLGSLRQEFLESKGINNDSYVAGFGSVAVAVEQGAASSLFAERTKFAKEAFRTANGEVIGAAIDDDPDAAQNISALLRGNIGRLGLSAKVANRDAVDAIVAKGTELAQSGEYEEAEAAIMLIGQVETKPGSFLSDSTYGKDQRTQALFHVQRLRRGEETYQESLKNRQWANADRPFTLKSQQWALEARERTREDWERADAVNDKKAKTEPTVTLAMMDIMANPNADISKHVADLLINGDRGAIRSLNAFQRQRQDSRANIIEDPVATGTLLRDILNGASGPKEILEAAGNGLLKKETVLSMMRSADSAKRYLMNSIKWTPVVQRELDGIRAGVKSVILKNGTIGDTDKRTRVAAVAADIAHEEMIDWTLTPEGAAALADPNSQKAIKAILEFKRDLQTRILDNPAVLEVLDLGVEDLGSMKDLRAKLSGEQSPNPYK